MARSKTVAEKPKAIPNSVFEKPFRAWHIASSQNPLILPDGQKTIHDGVLHLCQSGLHASYTLNNATSCSNSKDYQNFERDLICRVECNGEYHGVYDYRSETPTIELIKTHQKFVCSERTILWSMTKKDFVHMMRREYQELMISVLKWTDFPSVVVDFITDGNEVLAKYALNAIYEQKEKDIANYYGPEMFIEIMTTKKNQEYTNKNIVFLQRYSKNLIQQYVRVQTMAKSIVGMIDEFNEFCSTLQNYEELMTGKKLDKIKTINIEIAKFGASLKQCQTIIVAINPESHHKNIIKPIVILISNQSRILI